MTFFLSPKHRVLVGVASVWGAWAFTGEAGGAEANRYDLLGQVLEPLTAVFKPERAGQAFAATFVLKEATGLPSGWSGQEARLVFQPPRLAKASVTIDGEVWEVGRVGQELWGVPAEKWEPLAQLLPRRKKSEKRLSLPDFALPFAPEQLVFLPVLFQVDDEGVNASGARLLRVRLAPTIAEGLKAEAGKGGENPALWTMRFAVREVPGKRPRLEQLEVFRPGWRLAADVRRWTLVREVPESYWMPDKRAGAAFRFSGADVRRWWSGAWQKRLDGDGFPPTGVGR